jgi:anaerobic ribonucleoside-triphosphate reductase activating protein
VITPVLSVHAIETESRANGPGIRAVVWLQGCPLACPGCFNPETHASGGRIVGIAELVDDLLAGATQPSGLTLTGGEPLAQPTGVAQLIALWKERTGTSVIVSTGFAWEEITSSPELTESIAGADLVVAGRYNERLHLGSMFRGSANKTYHFLTECFAIEDMIDVPEFEALISEDGRIHVSGVAGSTALANLLGYESWPIEDTQEIEHA